MAEFPLQPMYAKMLLSSEEFGCSEEAVTIAGSMLLHLVCKQRQKGPHKRTRLALNVRVQRTPNTRHKTNALSTK